MWWFQGPDGSRFFSRGINVVDIGAKKDTYHRDKPEYASFRYYATTQAWADATLKRMRDWNFNTIGGWSHSQVEEGPLPFTVVLHLGEAAGGVWGPVQPGSCEEIRSGSERKDRARARQSSPARLLLR